MPQGRRARRAGSPAQTGEGADIDKFAIRAYHGVGEPGTIPPAAHVTADGRRGRRAGGRSLWRPAHRPAEASMRMTHKAAAGRRAAGPLRRCRAHIDAPAAGQPALAEAAPSRPAGSQRRATWRAHAADRRCQERPALPADARWAPQQNASHGHASAGRGRSDLICPSAPRIADPGRHTAAVAAGGHNVMHSHPQLMNRPGPAFQARPRTIVQAPGRPSPTPPDRPS